MALNIFKLLTMLFLRPNRLFDTPCLSLVVELQEPLTILLACALINIEEVAFAYG